MSDLIIPGAPRLAPPSLTGKMIWLYGEPKIGKTTFASEIGESWFLATEKGQDFVKVREPTQIESWSQFKTIVASLYKQRPTHFGDGRPIEWIVIDTVDKLFKYCNDHVCKEIGIEDPSELAMGKAWAKLRNEFHRVMNALRTLPYGLLCISHETRREQTIRNVKSFRIQPNVGASGYDWLLGGSDIIVRAFSQDRPEKVNGKANGRWVNERVMQLHPNAAVVAGGRMSQHLPPTMTLSAKLLLDAVAAADTTQSQTIDGTIVPSTDGPAEPSDTTPSQE